MPVAPDDERALGVVYTPVEVARPMAHLALDPLAAGRTADEVLRLRVCDPAIGEGAFLREVVEVLAGHLVRAWELAPPSALEGAPPPGWIDHARRAVTRHCLFGVDIDPEALARARCALGLEDTGNHDPSSIETGDAASRLVVADALAVDWRASFPEVFAAGGFDVVIGNPPYVRQEWLGAARADKSTLAQYACFDATADLYVYFLELAHRVLRPGGRFCLVVPSKWMTVAYGRNLRRFLSTRHSVDGVVDLSRCRLFAGADAFPCVVWGTNDAGPRGAIRALRASPGMTTADALALAASGSAPGSTTAHSPELVAERGGHRAARRASRAQLGSREDIARSGDQTTEHDHPRERWSDEPWHIETPTERRLIDRLRREMRPLSEIVADRPSRGIVSGLNRAFVLDRVERDRLLEREPRAAALVRPFVKGRDIRAWRLDAVERWILLVDRGTSLDQLPAVRAHLEQFRPALEPRPPSWTGANGAWAGRKPGTYAWYELQDPVGPLIRARRPRLLYQDIQSGPLCSLDRDGDVVPDTTVWMLPSDDRVVLAVLNSALYGWYARRRFPPALNGAVRPKLDYLRQLPIAEPSAPARREIEDLVEHRIALAGAPAGAARTAARAARELDHAVSRCVSDAYRLTEAERALVEAG